MKQDLKNKYPDLTRIEGTYAHALSEASKRLTTIFDTAPEDYKEAVLLVVEQTKQTPAQRKFVQRIERCNDPNEIAFMVYNAVLDGANMGVVK